MKVLIEPLNLSLSTSTLQEVQSWPKGDCLSLSFLCSTKGSPVIYYESNYLFTFRLHRICKAQLNSFAQVSNSSFCMPRSLRTNSIVPSVWNLPAVQAHVDQRIQQENMAAAAAAALAAAAAVAPVAVPFVATEVWKTTPFSGDFNPGSKLGNSIFLEKTKGLPEADRMDLTKKNAQKIHQYFQSRETLMGKVISKVPIEYNADGSIAKTANLLTQYQQMTLEDLQRAAIARFDTPLAVGAAIPQAPFTMRDLDPGNDADDKKQFYTKVHSQVVSQIIKNGLSNMGYNDLLLQAEKFSFHGADGEVAYDGSTMLFLIFQKIDPSTVVGLDSVLAKLERAKLGDHSNNVDTMLQMMENLHKTLKENGRPPENYRRLLLDALATGPNDTFNKFIQRIEDDVESGIGSHSVITPDALITAARTKFNNMDSKDLWDKVDPRDARIMALATIVENLQKGTRGAATGGTALAVDANQAWKSKTTDDEYIDGLPRWRIKNVGPSKELGGKTYYWCPHHVKPGKWDGMYVLHRPEQHKGRRKNGTATAATTATSDEKKVTPAADLQLASRLKEVMCTNLCMSAADVDALFTEAGQEN